MMAELPDDVKRWTAKRRQALLMQIWRGETTKVEAARQHGLTVREIEEWEEAAMMAMENSLRSRPRDEEAQREAEIKKLKEKVGVCPNLMCPSLRSSPENPPVAIDLHGRPEASPHGP